MRHRERCAVALSHRSNSLLLATPTQSTAHLVVAASPLLFDCLRYTTHHLLISMLSRLLLLLLWMHLELLSMAAQHDVMCSLADQLLCGGQLNGWVCRNNSPLVSVCTWEGILCNALGVVTALNLSTVQCTTGSNSSFLRELCSLPYLESIFLQHIALKGVLPTEIGRLIQLSHLNLDYNSITGKLPSQLGLLVRLKTLDVSFNAITGHLPYQISFLENLTYLGIAGNSFIDILPTFLFNMRSLQQLHLAFNLINRQSLPSEIGKLEQLQILDLYQSGLTGNAFFKL